MTAYLLPSPKIAGLLPAWASPAPLDRIQPAEALTPGEEAILLTALYHHDAAQEPGFRCADDALAGWLPVHQASRTWADNLIMYGYLRKHPNKRRKMWYGLTDDGLYRARLLADAEATADPPLPPTAHSRLPPLNSALSASAGTICTGSRSNCPCRALPPTRRPGAGRATWSRPTTTCSRGKCGSTAARWAHPVGVNATAATTPPTPCPPCPKLTCWRSHFNL
jgi:hypothetical protein